MAEHAASTVADRGALAQKPPAHIGRRRPAGRHSASAGFLRNSYALVLSTGASGALGLVYWVLAARYYDDSDVGRGSAALSALMLLTGVVSANFAGTLNRFIPKGGRRTGRVVAVVYLGTSALVAVLAVVLVFVLHAVGGPAYDILRDPGTALWFVVAAAAASGITVQDSVLTGLRAAVWVPVWNVTFATAKIVLLVVLAGTMPRTGVFYSWIIPMIIVMFPVNLLIFWKLLPRHVREPAGEAEPAPAQIARFFVGDYLGALFVYGAMFLVPILVAVQVAPHTYAYFFIAWAVASMMNLVAVNMATPMAVEGVRDPANLADFCRSTLNRALGLLLVGVVVVGLAAPYALGLLGSGYLDAVPLLQLLAFASRSPANKLWPRPWAWIACSNRAPAGRSPPGCESRRSTPSPLPIACRPNDRGTDTMGHTFCAPRDPRACPSRWWYHALR